MCMLDQSLYLLSTRLVKIKWMCCRWATFGTFQRVRHTPSKVFLLSQQRDKCKKLILAGLSDENEYLLAFDDGNFS